MYEASLQGVLKVILIILLVYYLLKIVTRFFGPVLLSYLTKKASVKFQKHFQEYQNTQTSHDKVTKTQKNTKQTSSNSSVGEYIDFEEIE